MRLVPLPTDPSVYVNLDALTSTRLSTTGTAGTVLFPTNHGAATATVAIVEGCTVEVVSQDKVWVWNAFSSVAEARREQKRISDLAWHRARADDG